LVTTKKSSRPLVPGSVIWVDLEPVAGHELGGEYLRPIIVLTHETHNRVTGRVSGIPCTTKGRGFATEVPIASLPRPCVAVLDQIVTVDYGSRRSDDRGQSVTKAELDAVRLGLKSFLML
jgi:mRNA interferase MazF